MSNVHSKPPLQQLVETTEQFLRSFLGGVSDGFRTRVIRSPLNLESWKLLVTFKIHQKTSNYPQESVKPDFKQLISHENRFLAEKCPHFEEKVCSQSDVKRRISSFTMFPDQDVAVMAASMSSVSLQGPAPW